MEAGYQVTDEVTPVLKRFTNKDWMDIEKRSMRKGYNYVRSQGRKNFKKKLPAASHQGTKYIDRLIDAITGRVYVVGKVLTCFKVHNAGKRESGSGTFRARFFEKGTYSKKTKKQRIKPLNYMEVTERALPEALKRVEKQLDVEIEKTLNKRAYRL